MAALRARLDPHYASKTRASAVVGLAAAALVAGAIVVPGRPGEAVCAAAAAFAVVATVCWLVLARAELQDVEARALWSLSALFTEKQIWPPLGGWALSADAAVTLLTEIGVRGLRTVVELGPGASSVVLGRSAPSDLEIYGVEHDSRFSAMVRWHLEQHGLTNYRMLDAPLTLQSLRGRSVEWYDPAALDHLPQHFDVLVVDGPPGLAGRSVRSPAWPILRHRMCSGGLVLVDDTCRRDERNMVRDWLAEGGLRVVHDRREFVLLEVE